MRPSGLQALALWAGLHRVSAQGGDPPPAATGTLKFGPTPSGSFGGQHGCIPIVPPQPTQGPPAPKPTTMVPKPTGAPVVTTVTLVGAVPGPGGKLPTTTVVWSSTKVPATVTVAGNRKPTTVPAWVCLGSLCNPECRVPVVQCRNNDGRSSSGFPFPKVSLTWRL